MVCQFFWTTLYMCRVVDYNPVVVRLFAITSMWKMLPVLLRLFNN